ncbi:MAG: prepilin-type N-terminal cleavage/methylation domain-containing protein [Planctomycetes bacterium]|nr:prepilin-type N-terminal cleavage/methylation domain-containing protein [Planctomycetota bacterium]
MRRIRGHNLSAKPHPATARPRPVAGPPETGQGAAGDADAFTLTELLVSIAVIAVLATILLPSLDRALLLARVARVRSDLKHIGIAVEAYATSYNRYPPDRLYCITAKRHLYHCLPPELWKSGCLDGPLEDLFHPGRTYRYSACGPGYVNDSPSLIRCQVPENFPLPGGRLVTYCRNERAPVKWIAWSVGPRGPLRSFTDVLEFNPYDPAGWYPRDRSGIVVHYCDGGELHFP